MLDPRYGCAAFRTWCTHAGGTFKSTASRWIYEPLILVNPLDGTENPWLASEWSQPDARS